MFSAIISVAYAHCPVTVQSCECNCSMHVLRHAHALHSGSPPNVLHSSSYKSVVSLHARAIILYMYPLTDALMFCYQSHLSSVCLHKSCIQLLSNNIHGWYMYKIFQVHLLQHPPTGATIILQLHQDKRKPWHCSLTVDIAEVNKRPYFFINNSHHMQGDQTGSSLT